MAFYGGSQWPEYVPAALRRRRAAQQVAALRKKGQAMDPAVVDGRGRAIARTFWGDAWCKNLETYSDYSNRLPRGRTYLRNGSVVDLQVAAGSVTALVQGSSLYRIAIKIRPLAAPRWKAVVRGCSGHIASLLELLRGGVSEHVMKIVTEPQSGLFPNPAEISLDCSCPDWATMCKHVAASLYGIGVRLDERPELLFTLRGVDAADLVAEAAGGGGLGGSTPPRGRVLDTGDLSAVFGVDIEENSPPIRPRNGRGPHTSAITSRTHGAVPEPVKSSAPAHRATRSKKDSTHQRGSAISSDAPLNLEERVVAFVAGNAGAGISEIAQALGVKSSALVVPIAVLMGEERIRTEGSGRSTRYHPTLELVARPRRRPPAKHQPAPSRGRTGSNVTELTTLLHDFICKRPGLRMEEISRGLATTTMKLVLPMKRLLVMKLVAKRGQRRATRYFPK